MICGRQLIPDSRIDAGVNAVLLLWCNITPAQLRIYLNFHKKNRTFKECAVPISAQSKNIHTHVHVRTFQDVRHQQHKSLVLYHTPYTNLYFLAACDAHTKALDDRRIHQTRRTMRKSAHAAQHARKTLFNQRTCNQFGIDPIVPNARACSHRIAAAAHGNSISESEDHAHTHTCT